MIQSKQIVGITTLLILDILWVGLFMSKQYENMIPRIQCGNEMRVKFPLAGLSYLLMVIGLVVFVLPNIRNLRNMDLVKDSLLYGFLFGVVLYGVYDLTAAAVIENWDMKLGVIDILWGGFVMFAAALVAGYSSADS